MKKATLLLLLIVTLAACNLKYETENDDNGNITRRTAQKGPFLDLELEMRGNVTFNEQETEITGISAGGYVKYVNKNIAIEATPGKKGTVGITVYKDGEELPENSDTGKEYLKDAIKDMKKLQDRDKTT